MSQREALATILVAFAEYYGQTLTANQVGMYVEDLSSLSADELKYACKAYRVDPKNTRMPLPAQLIAIARPIQSAEDAGKEIAAKVIGAVRSCGWTNPDRARLQIGEEGWQAVQLLGGWTAICESLTNQSAPTFQAQIRELVTTVVRKEKSEHGRAAAGLPSAHPVQALLSKATKSIPQTFADPEE